MPIYEYRCDDGHLFDVMQRMSDDPLTACEVCGAPVEKVLHPVAVHFKGSGFYTTDYGKKKGKGSADAKKAESNGSGGSESSPGSSDSGSGKSESKPAPASSSKSD